MAHARCPPLSVLAALALITACSSNKNHEERALVAKPKPDNCIDQCQPDPGPMLVDCQAAEEGLEFLRIWDFETEGTADFDDDGDCMTDRTEAVRFADSLYIYDDHTPDLRIPSAGWQPVSTELGRCQGAEGNHAFHIYGGLFRGWGGGFGGRVSRLKSSCLECQRLDPDNPVVADATLDVSAWDGVSFWARRGPDSQTGIRIAVGDKATDDDVAYLIAEENLDRAARDEELLPTYCRRRLECGCRSKPCTYNEDLSGSYCYDPEVDPAPPSLFCNGADYYDACGATKCDADNETYSQRDREFYDKSCTSYGFRGGVVADYCFDPETDPPPPDGDQLCGDHWLSPVRLGMEWKFYKVPFTDLLQQGWAKEQYFFDLTAVGLVRMTFDKGWIDYYIDDVSFYRRL